MPRDSVPTRSPPRSSRRSWTWPARPPMPQSASPRRPRAGSPPAPAWAWTRRCESPARSTSPVAERSYDIVLFGATGFTGGLTAEYLAGHVPGGARWALAGRSQSKLEDVRRRLGGGFADLPLPPVHGHDPG